MMRWGVLESGGEWQRVVLNGGKGCDVVGSAGE